MKVNKLAKNITIWAMSLAVASIAIAKLSGSLAPNAIEERLKPMGQVNVLGQSASEAAPTAAAGVTPAQIYDNNCKMCHQGGLAGAPRMGNKDDWKPRLEQGLDTLVKHAINGIRAMPPKGNCLSCTNEDIKATVEYMVKTVQ